MCKALVHSHLDYCDIMYHIIPGLNNQTNLGATLDSLMEKVERTRYQTALAITGTWQGSNRLKLYEELEWETLSDRRWCRCILQIHKIKNNLTPSYLRDDLPPFRGTWYRNNNPNTFREMRCETSTYKNSVFPDAISSWNNIITDFQSMPSFNRLKAHILSLIRPKIRTTFGVHDPLLVRYIFQLRMNFADPFLRFASVIKVLKVLAIFYLNVLVMQLTKQPWWQLRFLKFCKDKTWAI